MKRLIALIGVTALATPAFAQHASHGAHHQMPPTAEPKTTNPHAGHKAAQPAENPHIGHAMPAPAADPHSGHAMPEQAVDPHAGHAMPEQAIDPHAGHAMSGMAAGKAPAVAPPPPEAFTGAENAAETIYDPALFRRKRQEALIEEHGGFVTSMVLVDRLEYRLEDGRDGYKWEGEGWYGGDYDKLWIKTEGEGTFGEAAEQIEVQALYSRAIDPWFNLQAGIRQDFRPGPDRTYFVLGIEGLAPYWLEVDGQLFLSNKGDVTARFEAEYDQRITQRLILQPAAEFNLAAQDVPELGIGSGLSTVEAGLRLRYELRPEFAPYVGVEYERSLGDTADLARAADKDVGGWTLLIGLRSWF